MGVPVLTVVGSPQVALAVVPQALAEEDVRRVTLPRGAVELLRAHDAAGRIGPGDDWDWFWTSTAPPPEPGEERVERLEDADDEVRDLLAASSPRHSAVPGAPGIERWVGVRDNGGRLVAVAANEPMRPACRTWRRSPPTPTCAAPGSARRSPAALTRALLAEGNPVVTLGMYADNVVARRMYLRLGFRCAHEFTSRTVLDAEDSPPEGDPLARPAPAQPAVVADDDQRALPLAQRLLELLDQGQRQVVGRLVEQQHVRVVDHQPREGDPSLLADRHLPHRRAQLARVHQADVEQRGDVVVDLALAPGREHAQHVQRRVGPDGVLGQQAEPDAAGAQHAARVGREVVRPWR